MIQLEITQGISLGSSFVLAKPLSCIGSDSEADLCLEGPGIAARHVRLTQGLNDLLVQPWARGCTLSVLRPGGPQASHGASQASHGASQASHGASQASHGASQAESQCIPLHDAALALRDGDVLILGEGETATHLRLHMSEAVSRAQVVEALAANEEQSATLQLRAEPAAIQALYRAQSRIGRQQGLQSTLEAIADAVFLLVDHATHVTLVLRRQSKTECNAVKDRKGADYLPVLTRIRPGEPDQPDVPIFIPTTRSVYRRVLENRTAVLAADAPKKFNASASLLGASVRSCIAVPLWLKDDILGVLQVDNREAPGMLAQRDLELLLVLAEQASVALHKADVVERLQRAEFRLQMENRFLREREREGRGSTQRVKRPRMVAESQVMKELLALVERVAATDATVLIEGPTGSGKECIATAIHERSQRRDRIFIAQNCAALNTSLLESELFGHQKGAFTGAERDRRGLFEIADGSTLFLDEITEASPAIQSKLLRILQEGELRPVGADASKRVDVRVVAATNRDLQAEVAAGRFREDLYYRLKVFPLRVPALRERPADILPLFLHFAEQLREHAGKALGALSSEAQNYLINYRWPGNVRQLQNEVQRVAIQAEGEAVVAASCLSPEIRELEKPVAMARGAVGALKQKLSVVERHLVFEALRENRGNKTAAAKSLGISREGLHKKLRGFAAKA